LTEPRKRSRAVFRPVRRGYWTWVRAVSHEMRAEVRRRVENIDTGESIEVYPAGWTSAGSVRRSIESRATKLVRCMRRVEGRVCGNGTPGSGCGRPVTRGVFRMKPPRHGRRVLPEYHHSNERCHARSCPRCARIRAAHYHAFGAAVADLFAVSREEQIAAYGWHSHRARLVTLTSVRDPADPEAHTVKALADRADGLRRAVRAIVAWQRDSSGARRPHVGAFYAVECAGTGHIHVHVLAHVAWVEKAEWIEVGRAGYTDRHGRHFDGYPELGIIADVRLCDEKTIAEVAKYPLKTPGSGIGAEDWIAGEPREVMHPVLVARWEIATLGTRLVERYGLCRAVKLPDEDESECLCERCASRENCPKRDEEKTECPAYVFNLCAACQACKGCVDAATWVVKCDRFDSEMLLGTPAAPCSCGCTVSHVVCYPTREWIALCRVAGRPAFGTPRADSDGTKGVDHDKSRRKGTD
jgi:hypothetical protein